MFSNEIDLKGMRAVALLRQSTLKQLTEEDRVKKEKDIPAQRDIVNEFIAKTGLIKVRDDFVEGGVSGFKVKMDKRDKVNKIKALADRKEFDVLVVYYSDRIGRTSEESPLVIKYLNDRGIIVISVREGIISTKSQTDKLITYITFWNNENESIKISNRSTDYHILLIKSGRYRGGGERTLAYGYRLVDKGTKNPKGRNILDVEIDPETSKIVVLIYDLSINYNMGARSIASYLNEQYRNKAKSPKGWSYTAITYILSNPIYKGIIRMYSHVREEEIVCNQVQEYLIIISEDIWDKNQEMIRGRSTNGKPKKGITASRVLLSGLVYCGYCGSKMYVWANYKHYTKKNGERTNYVKDAYKCPAINTRGKVACSGQTTYSAKKIDEIVESETISFIQEISQKSLTEEFKKNLQQGISNLINTKKEKENGLADLQADIVAGKKEILKATRGEGLFTPEELRESIDMAQKEVDGLQQELYIFDKNIAQAKSALAEYKSLDTNLRLWEEKYTNGDMATKKALLGSVIDRVTVYNDNAEIRYRVAVEAFIQNSDGCGSNISPLARAHGSGP